MSSVNAAFSRERQFISDAAHELRTPLAGIKAHAQLALKDKCRQQASLSRIVEGVDRTTRLANQLLTLSGVDSMRRLENARRIDMRELIATVVGDLDADRGDKTRRITTEIYCDLPLIGNQDLIYILLRNLIDNAIRYSPPDSEVKVIYQKNNDQLLLIISDRGPGIPASDHQRVFDRFYRDIENHSQGSGLGLAIAKKIVLLHKAGITLDQTEDGQGLTVMVNFEK